MFSHDKQRSFQTLYAFGACLRTLAMIRVSEEEENQSCTVQNPGAN